MNINQMYYYVAVCDCESFSKAAEKVFVSQPTLSKQIAALEAELGLQLIDRRRGGHFSLTGAGQEYLKSFRRILDEFEDANLRAKFGEVTKRRRYRIGALDDWLLHDLIRRCTRLVDGSFPDVELEFDFYSPSQLAGQRSAGALDLCLVAEDAYRPAEGYGFEPLAEVPGLLYVSAKNTCIEGGDLRIFLLKNEPLFSLPLTELPGLSIEDGFRIMGERGLAIKERPTLRSVHLSILSSNGYGFGDAWSDVAYNKRFLAKRLPMFCRKILLSRREDDRSELTEALVACIRDWAAAPSFSL